jgi:alpha-1,2-mannosyltransferase
VRIALTAVLLAASTVLTAFTVLNLGVYSDDDRPAMAWATYTLWALFALSVWALKGVRGRAVTALVLIGCAVLGAAAMAGPPNTSTDSARYAWDGIVQNAGISPYEYVPADPALADLRTDWLFPAPTVAADGSESCDGERISKTREVGTGEVLCTAINRPQVPTIYPPLAEMLFAGVRFFVGPSAEYWPLQAVGLLFVLGTAALLLRALRRRGLPGWQAALWAWCPLVLAEGVTNSHVDLVGAVLILVATLSVTIGRRALGGVALGGAIAVKLIPVIAAPALLRRQGWKVVVAAIATFAVLYIPYILSTGIGVLGYLPGYLSEEGYEDGSRFGLISLFAPGSAALPVAAILLVVTAVAVIVATDPERP